MRRFFRNIQVLRAGIGLAGLVVTTGVQAGPLRGVAETFGDSAPDQDTLHELLAQAPDPDAEDRAAAQAMRLEKISELEQTYAAGGSEITRAGALFELIRLHGERAFDVRDQAEQEFRTARDRWWIGELAAEPTLNVERYKEALLKTVNFLRDMNANFPKDPRIAEINWLLASTAARAGSEHSEQYFRQAAATARTPEMKSRVALSRADWMAAQGRWDEAIKVYGEVRDSIKAAGDPLKAYATYRLGWAWMTKGQPTKAEAALKLTVLGIEDDGETRFRLRQEALNDLTWLWATQGQEQEAKSFAEKQDAPEVLALFRQRLAQEWLRQGKPELASAYFRDLIARNPEDPRLPDYHLTLAHAWVTAGNMPALQAETQALTRLTTDPESPWLDEHEDDTALVERARKMVKLLPLASGFKIFKAASAEKDPKKKKTMLTTAVQELQSQAAGNQDPERALTIRMTLVQALIGLERYMEVLDQLDAIVKMGPKAEPYLADAAFERLKVLVKLDGEKNYPPVPPPGEVKAPIPLPELKVRFAAAAGEYLRIVPEAENAVNLRYQIAQDLFTYGHYDKALPLFEALVPLWPRSEQAKAAIEICLSMNLKLKNYPELIRLSTAFLNNRAVKGKSLRDYIKENLDWARAQTADGATAH